MKKTTIVLMLFLLLLTGCLRRIEPLEEQDLKVYLYGKDDFIADNQLRGDYKIMHSDGNKLQIEYSGENSLLKYRAIYTVENEIKERKWQIVSFVIENRDVQLQDISADLIELVKKSDEKINNNEVEGNFQIKQLKLVENKVLFSLTFTSKDQKYQAYFEGSVKNENNKMVMERIIERITEKEETLESANEPSEADDGDETTQYTGDSKLIYDYYVDKNFSIEEIENVRSVGNNIQATVKVSDLWQYLKEVYVIEVQFKKNGTDIKLVDENIISDEIKSRLTGKYVNQDRILISEKNRSYIIFNEDFSFTLVENSIVGFETLEEFYAISYSTLTLKNRKLQFEGYKNNEETFIFEINSLQEVTCLSNIITTRKGDKFVKIE